MELVTNTIILLDAVYLHLVHFPFFEGGMELVHISGPWSGPGPKWGSMDPGSMFCPHPNDDDDDNNNNNNESENFKILWDFTVQCNQKIEARRPDIVCIDKKEKEVVTIDVAIPGDDGVKDKELEKLEKYQLLKDEIAKVWCMRKVIVAFCYWVSWNCISQL